MGHPSLSRTLRQALARSQMAPWVFLPGAIVIALVSSFGIVEPELAKSAFGGAKRWLVGNLGWLFNASVSCFLAFVVVLAASPYGRIRLGADDSRPEFRTLSWFAMLFSAGMGIGLMFFGVAEPMYHLEAPPMGAPRTDAAARLAVGTTFYHWGLHAWGIYVLMGLGLAYFSYRRGLPLSIRSVLHPLLGDRIHGRLGDAVDLLAVFGTVFGLATSLGIGARQVNAGFEYLVGLPNDEVNQVVIIVLVTAAACASLLSGLDRGIRLLSELNLVLAGGLLLFVFVLGPTDHVVSKLPDDVIAYGKLLYASFVVGEHTGSEEWQASWSVFYWAWWIAWAPFVGMFIARISRGRTIRELVFGVLLVPTLVTICWLLVFGETAMFFERVEHAGIAEAVRDNDAVAIYSMLSNLPLAGVASTIAVLTVIVFFVTSSDSGSFVVDTITSGGHPNPPVWQRFFWATAEGVTAIVLLLAGGLEALQSAVIATGFPFCIVLLLSCVALAMALRREGLHATRGAEPTTPSPPSA